MIPYVLWYPLIRRFVPGMLVSRKRCEAGPKRVYLACSSRDNDNFVTSVVHFSAQCPLLSFTEGTRRYVSFVNEELFARGAISGVAFASSCAHFLFLHVHAN